MTESKPNAKVEGHRYWRLTIVIASMAFTLLLVGSAVRPNGASAYSPRTPVQAGNFNYGEALQKAIWFYEAQISGPKPPWSRVTWRGDSALNDGSDVARDLSGGWFDAGDHVKFGFAMASSATMLAWGGVEYRQAYEDSGQIQHLLNNLRVVNDYFIKAHSAANELYGQVGDAGLDHSFWGPAEIMQMQRPAFKIDLAHGGSDLAAETAAAMAASSVVFRATDPAYANTLVLHARQLFAFAEATYHPTDLNTQGNGNFYVDAIPAAQGFYNSRFGNPNDEMAWGAAWMFLATNETTFRDRARQLYPTMCKENGTQTPCFTWTQSWNDKHFGTYVLMAKLTGEDQFKTDAQRWLDYWSVGAGTRTAGGLMFVNGFGSLRYATNTAFIALVYADLLGTANPLYPRYHDFAKRQIDYVLGANPANHSYVCGFGNNPPINPHHRTAHGSWVNGGPQGAPTNSRHVLYGGLVCGPTSANDFAWADDRGQFMENEVATDFNAGFAGAAARLFREFGGTPLANFPPIETPDDDEIYIEAGINVAGTNFTEIRAFVVNRSAWPARMLDGGTFRYFFTLEPGVTPSQITVNNNFSQCGGGITGPTQWSGNIYYVTINCLGTKIFPGGQSEFRREVQFRIASSGAWNPADDPSFLDIAGATGGQTVRTRRIVLYDDGVRIWGNEPGPPVPDFSLSASPSSLTINRGASGSSAITITRTGGFTGSVAFSASGLPAGVTATFTPTSTTGNSVTLNLAVSATATLGSATVTITGAGGGPTHTVPISLTVTQPPQPDFTISANPTSVSINRGASGSSTVTIARVNGFTSSVAFTTSALPSGVTAAFVPTSTTGNSSTLTFTASTTATLGSVIVTISGAGGTLTRTTTITLTVTAPQIPDFTLSASPQSISISVGSSGTSTIGISRIGGFTAAVALSATGLPGGVTAAFNPASATGASSILTLTASSTATAGTTTVTVTGIGGTLTRTVTISLTVTAVQTPNFTLSASPASLTVSRGSAATSTITITRTGGFTANVALSATGLPAGVTAAFNPASAGGTSSVLTLNASSTATTGAATITVTGVNGALTRTTTLSLTVNAVSDNGGVTITPVINASGPWFNEEAIRLSNTGTLTSLSVTIVIQRTGGISLNGQYNTVGGQILQSNSTTATAITYQFTLATGQTLGTGTNRLFAAQTSGSGTVHPTTGDTYTITYTTGGATFTQTGTF